jgi:hypothetical protein
MRARDSRPTVGFTFVPRSGTSETPAPHLVLAPSAERTYVRDPQAGQSRHRFWGGGRGIDSAE